MIVGVNVIWAYVDDMAVMSAFYRDVLELTIETDSPYWYSFRLSNGVILALHPHPPERPRGRSWVLGLECQDIKALRAKLEPTGVTMEGWHETPAGVILIFEDPEGNVINVMQLGSTMADFS